MITKSWFEKKVSDVACSYFEFEWHLFYLRNILPPSFDPQPTTTNVMNRLTKNQGLVYADDNQKLYYVYCGDEVYFLLHRLVCDFRKGVIIVLRWRQIKDMRWFIRDDFVMSLPPTIVNDFRKEVINVLRWRQIEDIRNYCSCKRIVR